MLEDNAYQDHLKETARSFEGRCKRCGACCGAFEEDPCSLLRRSADGPYFCADYENRLKAQKTVKGREFMCVPVRKILFESWSGSWNCAYKRSVNSQS